MAKVKIVCFGVYREVDTKDLANWMKKGFEVVEEPKVEEPKPEVDEEPKPKRGRPAKRD